ncbi:MAG TPA: hypothetical protein VKU35_02100 [Candidatus Limnocylindria bacterium]|nr:hypothetical protein [Candidatus Limnocylindria bacterium]
MHPYLRVLVVGAVALIVAGGLVALALLGRNTTISVLALLGAGLIAILIGLVVFWQSWVWSQRTWRAGSAGRSLGIALAGALAIVLAGVALAGTAILLLTFGLG